MKLEFIDRKSIHIGKRHRKQYDEIGELAYSIRKNGLITALAMSRNPDTEGPPWLLAAGGRRIKAIDYICEQDASKDIISDFITHGIPCRLYDTILTDVEYRSVELAENIDRTDLRYHERVANVQEIHQLQIAIHGEKISKTPGASGWSQSDTANMLGMSSSQITDDLKLARGIGQFPALELDKCKNKTEAMKRLAKFGEVFITRQKSQEFEQRLNDKMEEIPDPATGDPSNLTGSDQTEGLIVRDKPADKKRVIIKDLLDSYMIADFFDGVKEMPDNTFDLIEVDPPYGVDLKGTKSGDTYGYNEVEKKDYIEFLMATFKECYRVAKQDSWIIVWFAPDPWVLDVYPLLIDAGYKATLNFGAWYKAGSLADSSSGQNLQPKWKLANCYELFIYGWKGRPTLGKPGATNGFPYKPISPSSKIHPTERPIELMEDVLTTFGRPGDRVLCPFLGSGVTLLAAYESKMYAMGCDLTKMFKEGFTVKLFDHFK